VMTPRQRPILAPVPPWEVVANEKDRKGVPAGR
jgi:hypothetical protein